MRWNRIFDCPLSNLHHLAALLIQLWHSSSARRNSSPEQSSRLAMGQQDSLTQSGLRSRIFCETTDDRSFSLFDILSGSNALLFPKFTTVNDTSARYRTTFLIFKYQQRLFFIERQAPQFEFSYVITLNLYISPHGGQTMCMVEGQSEGAQLGMGRLGLAKDT